MLRNLLFAIVVSLLIASPMGAAGNANGDVLLIEEVWESLRRDLPSNGLSKSQVRERFGAPAEEHEPVGDPPISRWVYDDYTVYFEHDLVLNSVLNRGAVLNRTRGDD